MSNTDDESPVRTGGGDDGRSTLIDGDRRFKDDIAFEALGALDEAQVALGVCRSLLGDRDDVEVRLRADLEWIQRRMLIAGGVVAAAPGSPHLKELETLGDEDLATLDRVFSYWRGRVTIPPRFFIAGDTSIGAEFDRARTVVRRAERAIVRLIHERGGYERTFVSRFLNALSDLGFVLARWADEFYREPRS